jgi:cyclophilin family peptidyl-prolyl cis-trans isomerase
MPSFVSLLTRCVLTTALLTQAAWAQNAPAGNPKVRITTNMGALVVELEPARAPITVKNFLEYAKAGHYNGTIFHRVIPGFVLQGGGFDPKGVEKPARASIFNESGNGLSNRHSTIAMARTGDPHSANAQFYINLADNVALDPQPGRWGYAVFGRVIEGMDLAQKMGEVSTGTYATFDDAPLKPIVIEKVEVVE